MSDCQHTGRVRLDIEKFCGPNRKTILTCQECGQRVPKGHYRRMYAGTRTPRPSEGPPHWDHSGYEVRGGYHNCGADQT